MRLLGRSRGRGENVIRIPFTTCSIMQCWEGKSREKYPAFKKVKHFSLGFVTSGKARLSPFDIIPGGGKWKRHGGGEQYLCLQTRSLIILGSFFPKTHTGALLPSTSLPVATTRNFWLTTQRKWHLSSCAWLDHPLIWLDHPLIQLSLRAPDFPL